MDQATSDEFLAALAAKGDGDAFRVLLERHYDRMFSIAYRFTAHREEAEDIVQDICVTLPGKLKGYRGGASFTTWLYRVVVNRAKDARRKASTANRMHLEYGEVDALRRDEEAQNKQDQEWLDSVMLRLPSDLRETAVLVVGEGMKHAEAAEIMEISEGTVSWRMSELKKALRQMAKEEA